VSIPPVCGLLGQGIDVLDHLDPGCRLGEQTGFLQQLARGRLRHRLAGLDSAGDDVSVAAVRDRSMQNQNLGATLAGREHSYFDTRVHLQSVRLRP
jgi:hypothetical protein